MLIHGQKKYLFTESLLYYSQNKDASFHCLDNLFINSFFLTSNHLKSTLFVSAKYDQLEVFSKISNLVCHVPRVFLPH
jgi:hypothetical protein